VGSLPYVGIMIMYLVAGSLADWMIRRGWSITFTRRLMQVRTCVISNHHLLVQCVSLVGAAGSFVVMPYVDAVGAVALLVAATTLCVM
jgi:hypothetical protein